MNLNLNGFVLNLSVLAIQHGHWIALPLTKNDRGFVGDHKGIHAELDLQSSSDRISYTLRFIAPFRTRIRLRFSIRNETNLFHLIPANIHGDNNAPHVRPGEFPCLTNDRPSERNRAPLWEFRADRSSHPVSIICCANGAVGVSIDPYSDCTEADDGFIRNGVFSALPDEFGVSLGYGNDPLTFVEKTYFLPASSDLCRGASANGTIYAIRAEARRAAHTIIRDLHTRLRDVPEHANSYETALRALADSFATVNWSPELQQYTNRKCRVPVDTALKPWRAIVEIGWTGGSMLAYPFELASRIFADLKMPQTGAQIFDEICSGFNEASGFINDTVINRFTRKRPEGYNASDINGWWSGFLPQTRDNHCAYTNAHAAYYMMRTIATDPRAALGYAARRSAAQPADPELKWIDTALRVLDTAIELQRDDGAFGYVFSPREQKVIDWEGFAGCWFIPALVYAWKFADQSRYLESAKRAIECYAPFVRDLSAWGSPMDTYKSVDSEGNLAFIRAARLLHEFTGDDQYVPMLLDGAHYEYLWRYGFRTRPQCPPLKGSNWNSCGGSITSVSNPHIHPMSVVATDDLEYLAQITDDSYHQARADDGIAWLMNTMELYPDVVGYGRYGILSERTCPSDGLLSERYYDDNSPASTWWSYNAWAAGSAMEALAERILRRRGEL
jgi:hypothetical protein